MSKAIAAEELSLIKSDVAIADFAVNMADGGIGRDFLCQAAYHYAQAAEKSMKAIIEAERPELFDGNRRTHDLTLLMMKAEIARQGTIAGNMFLAEHSEKLSNFNELRYGDRSICRKEVMQLREAVKNLVDSLESDFTKENPDKKKVEAYLKKEWASREQTRLPLGTKLSTEDITKKMEKAETKEKRHNYNKYHQKKKRSEQER